MGDCDFLYGMNSAKPQGADKHDYGIIMCIETGEQEIVPLLWGALFSSGDVHTVVWEDDGEQHPLSVWHTSVAAGLENLQRRKSSILPRVHSSLHPFIDAFEQALAVCKYSHIQLDMSTLGAWLSYDQAATTERVMACLNVFDSGDGWAAYYQGPVLTNTYELYGMKFLFSDWSPAAGQVGWYRVDSKGKIVATGNPGGLFTFDEDEAGDKSGEELPLFFTACARGELPVIRSLLSAGQDVNEGAVMPNTSGVTGLMLASLYGHAGVAAELIRAGANVDAKTDKGAFALGLAAEDGHAEVVKLLLEAGADPHAQNEDGWDALFMASIYRHKEVQDVLNEALDKDAGAK